MSNITDLFNLNPGDTYKNTLASVIGMVNEYEKRKVQREQIASQNRGQDLEFQAKEDATQSYMAAKQAQLAQQEKQNAIANQLANDRLTLDTKKAQHDKENDEAKLGLEQEKFGMETAFKQKESDRADTELGFKQEDRAKAEADRAALSESYKNGDMDSVVKTLIGMNKTDEATRILKMKDDMERNVYLNKQTLAETNKTEDAVEAGRRYRSVQQAGYRFMNNYKQDPDGALKGFRNDIAQDPNLSFMKDWSDDDIAFYIPHEVGKTDKDIASGTQTAGGKRLWASNLLGMYGPNDPRVKDAQAQAAAMEEPTETSKKINEYHNLVEAGDKKGAAFMEADLSGKNKGALVNIGTTTNENGEQVIAPTGTTTGNEIQKSIRDNQDSLRELSVIRENSNKGLDSVMGLSGTINKGIAKTADFVFSGDISNENKQTLDTAVNILTASEQFFQTEYRKGVTGASAATSELNQLRKAMISGEFKGGPYEFRKQLNNIYDKYERQLGADTQRARQGGVDVSSTKNDIGLHYDEYSDEEFAAERQRRALGIKKGAAYGYSNES